MRHKKPKAVRTAAARTKQPQPPPPPPPPVKPHILSLPQEIRNIIVDDVVRQGRRRLPRPTPKFIKNRLRVWNCFDEAMPSDTNLFLPATPDTRIHGNGLRGTCRLLRQDTLQALERMQRRQGSKAPYVLDLLIVEHYGVFPTWMSFPYQPARMDQLQINIRVLHHADAGLLPREWHFTDNNDNDISPPGEQWYGRLTWNLVVAIVMYSTGRLAQSAPRQLLDRARPVGKRARNMPVVIEARLRPAPRHVIDHVLVDWHGLAYRADGTPVAVPDPWCRESYFANYVDYKMAELLRCREPRAVLRNKYHAALVGDIGSLVLWESDARGRWYLYGFPGRRLERPRTAHVLRPPWAPADGNVAAALARAEAAAGARPSGRVHSLRLVRRRMDLGWWGAEWKRAVEQRVKERLGDNYSYYDCSQSGFDAFTVSEEENDSWERFS